MTEAMKRYLEIASSEDEEYIDRLSTADMDKIIAMAAEKGVELTPADFEEGDDDRISLDELDAVAGGGMCVCPLVGGGKKSTYQEKDGTGSGDGACACVFGGRGDWIFHDDHKKRCVCFAGGAGKSHA